MPKSNLPKAILVSTFLAAFTLIAGLFVYGYLETKKAENSPIDFIEPIKSVENNNGDNNQEPEPTEPAEPETYEAKLFIEAQWGNGEGEVGISNYGGDEDGAGLIYGPQSFDIDDMTGYLYLLDSINERVMEYDNEGKYLRDFSIGYGGTTDIKIQDEYIYILSFGSDAVYKHDMSGEMLDSYSLPGKNPGIGTGGIEFDENGNVMVEINIDGYYNEESRFYEIGKNGDEWKANSYSGNISRDKKGFYSVKGADLSIQKVQILDRLGEIQKEFTVNLNQKIYIYYEGNDKDNNIYLSIGYKNPIKTEKGISDEFIFKYNKDGLLLSKFDLFTPLRKFFTDDEIIAIPRLYQYARKFRNIRIANKGDVYWITSFKDEGLKIFKYSKI